MILTHTLFYPVIRPPYGNANTDTVEKLESRGYSVIEWSTDSKDYETHDLESEMENIRESITSNDEGYIILTHDVSLPHLILSIVRLVIVV